MAKRRRLNPEEVEQAAFDLALTGLIPNPRNPYPLMGQAHWTRREIIQFCNERYGKRAAKVAARMRLFTQH